MPDILKGETARPPPKRHIYRVWLIFKQFVFAFFNHSQSSHASINLQSAAQLHGSPKQSTEVVDNLVEKADADREL
jgi:hypothetical protein